MPPRRRQPKRPPPPPRPAPGPRTLQYKVVELSSVDEQTLERTLNEWAPRGWSLDGVQFAMRESSKRPAMAFVFFTREGPPVAEGVEAFAPVAPAPARPDHPGDDPGDAWTRLARLAHGGDEP